MNIAIVGTGYVGLVSGTCFADTGVNVLSNGGFEKFSGGRRAIRWSYGRGWRAVEGEGVKKLLTITLKYSATGERAITGLKRISKPGLRVYAGAQDIPKVLGGLGIAIVSTNKGVITDKKARELAVGGEVLAFVW